MNRGLMLGQRRKLARKVRNDLSLYLYFLEADSAWSKRDLEKARWALNKAHEDIHLLLDIDSAGNQ